MELDFNFYEKIVDGWERTESANGVPYYVNHKTERTSWDHPYWMKIVEGLKEFDNIKYAAYRTAFKVKQLQEHLQLHHVELHTVRNEFEDQGHVAGDWESIHCDDLLILLMNMYKSSHVNFQQIQESEMLADLALNLHLVLFDQNKTGFVPVISAKLLLMTLCSASLTEKYRYFYQELHDPSTYIRNRSLTTFLESLMTLPDFLHESLAFGRTCEPAVASCSQMGIETGGITEDVFYRWLNKEPQTIVWLPTLHRVATTQTIKHDVKCNVCKTYPMVGFRYKCLKCFNFDMCQACFFTGRSKKKHKAKHPMQEYCLNSTAKDGTAAFVKTLKYNLSRKQRKKVHQKYLPIEADGQYTNMAWSPEKGPPVDADIHTEISETAHKLAQLEMVDRETSPIMLTPELTPRHDNKYSFQNLSPKNDGLQKERDELNSIIEQLQEENRALYKQLSEMKENEDCESVNSDDEFTQSKDTSSDFNTPVLQRIKEALKETYNFPVREPHPSEATPIYLSVPIIQLNGSTFNRYVDNLVGASQNSSLNSSGPRSAFRQPLILSPESHLSNTHNQPVFSSPESLLSNTRNQPVFTSPESCQSNTVNQPVFSSPESPPYNTENQSPPRGKTLGDSLDNLDASPSRFSLPSPTKSHNDFLAEEAELQNIVRNVNNLFPTGLSYTGNNSTRLDTEDNEVLQAADSIGAAMTQFVNRAVNIKLPEAY